MRLHIHRGLRWKERMFVMNACKVDYSVKDTLNTIESGHKENSFPMGKDCNYTLKTGRT